LAWNLECFNEKLELSPRTDFESLAQPECFFPLFSSHRCQSLLYLRLYKLCKKELNEYHKILESHLNKATAASEHSSPNGQPTISPTPSPAGSEGSVCSKSSGYTSSNELMGAGGMPAPPSLTVPQTVMQKHHQYVNFLSQCHDLWETADLCAHRNCEGKLDAAGTCFISILFVPKTFRTRLLDKVSSKNYH
jgi:hypothetical protein